MEDGYGDVLDTDTLCDMALRSLDAVAVKEVDVINPHVMDLVRTHGSTMTNSEIVQKFLPLQRLSAYDLDAVIEACAKEADAYVSDGNQYARHAGRAVARRIRSLDRSKINAAQQDAMADENMRRPQVRREETVDAPAGAAPDVRELLRECRAELMVVASYANDPAANAGLQTTAKAYQRLIDRINATLLAQPAGPPDEKGRTLTYWGGLAAAGVSEERYEVQHITHGDTFTPNFRVTDKKTDSRIATCYERGNADLIVAALNRHSLAERSDRVSVPREPDDDIIESMMLCWLEHAHPYSADFGATQEQLGRMRVVYKSMLNTVQRLAARDEGGVK